MGAYSKTYAPGFMNRYEELLKYMGEYQIQLSNLISNSQKLTTEEKTELKTLFRALQNSLMDKRETFAKLLGPGHFGE